MRHPQAPALALVGALLLTACASDAPTPSDNARRDVAKKTEVARAAGAAESGYARFRLRPAMRTVRQLASNIGIRERATSGEHQGSRLIARKFRRYGYEVRIQKYEVDGGISRNVIARWPEQIRHPFVIGAHMDTVPGSPGANDNASGTATILEAARVSAGRRASRLITWVAFGSEEFGDDGRHHVGSQVYVNRSTARERERMPGMISVDMIADGKPLLTGSFGIGPRVLGRILYRRIDKHTNVAVRYETLCDCSDNGPFEHAGIPGAYMHSGREPDYHSPSDIPDNLRRKHILRTGKALMLFVRRLDAATLRYLRRF